MRALVSALVLSVALLLPGCSSMAPTSICIDYAVHETPLEARDAAQSVIKAEIVDVEGRGTYREVIPTREVTLRVLETVRGDDPGTEIPVISVPASCMSSDRDVDATPDPFADRGVGSTVYVLLYNDGGQWHTVNFEQGVIDPAPDGSFPEAWPTP